MRAPIALVASIAVLAVACAAEPPADAPPDSPAAVPGGTVAGATSGTMLAGSCTDTTEAGALRCGGGLVTRDGPRLRIQTSEGRALVLEDDTAAGDDYARHEYRGRHAGMGAHLVAVSHYEGRSFLLVAETTGDTTRLAAAPVVSPDAQRFVVASMDMEAAFDPTIVQVWRMTSPGKAALEYSIEPEDWGPSEPVWVDASTVEFTRNRATDAPGQYRTEKARLVLAGGKWELRPAGG